MDHPVTPQTDFLRSPLGIAVLMLVSSIGGGLLKDRLSTESRDTASVIRIEASDRRLNDLEAMNAKRFDELRADLRDLKLAIEYRSRAERDREPPK